ncbi:hypothetical protein ACB092_04G173700 [Castanea dentata]
MVAYPGMSMGEAHKNNNNKLNAKFSFQNKKHTHFLSLSLCVRIRVREKNGGASCGGASTDEDGVAAIDVRKRDTDPPTEDRLLCIVVSQFPPIHQIQSRAQQTAQNQATPVPDYELQYHGPWIRFLTSTKITLMS